MTPSSETPGFPGRLLSSPWPQDAVIAASVFLVGYLLLPALLMLFTHLKAPVALLQLVATMASFVFATLALFKLFQGRGQPEPEMSERLRNPQTTMDDATVMVLPKARKAEPPARPIVTRTAEIPRHPPPPPVPEHLPAGGEWTLQVLQQLEWKRFEDLCAAYYREKGIRFDFTPLAKDGGLNLRLYQDDSGRPTSIVQCKGDSHGHPIGVDLVCELLGAMTEEHIPKAFFMTPGDYTEDARAIAQQNGITLMDGKLVLAMLKHMPHDARSRLLAFAAGGDYATPTCPACSVKMVARQNGHTAFWGCPNHPRCEQTLPMRGGRLNTGGEASPA